MSRPSVDADDGFPRASSLIADPAGIGLPMAGLFSAVALVDPARLVASSAKAQRELLWRPRYPQLRTIIQHAWNWHLECPKGYAQGG